jgi:hypothetical protein
MKNWYQPALDLRVRGRSAHRQPRNENHLETSGVQMGTTGPVDRRRPGLELLQQDLCVFDGTDALKKYRVTDAPDGH